MKPQLNLFNEFSGRSWLKSFLRRYPELAIRKPEGITSASANVVEQDIRKWFREVQGILLEEGLVQILQNAKCVLNGDESSFYLDPTVDKVIACRGENNVYKVDQGPAKKNITVMFTCSAEGKMYPPMVVFPYQKIPCEVTRSVPANWGIAKTDSGWMTGPCFWKYVRNILHPQLVEEKALPAVYFIDGHSSHTAWETAEECRKLGIHLVCLYPNCTRILQPLDVAVFKPLKISWTHVVDDWKLAYPNKYLRTENFAPLLAKALDMLDSNVIRNGFNCCGLFPFDENNVDYTKCLGRNRSMPQPEKELLPVERLAQVERVLQAKEVLPQVEGLPGSSQSEKAETNDFRRRSQPEDDYPTEAEAGYIVETFPVIRSEAEKILQMIGPERQKLFQTRDIDDFTSMDELILARVFKLLEPLVYMTDCQEEIEIDPIDADPPKDHAEPIEHILAEYVMPEYEIQRGYSSEIDFAVSQDNTTSRLEPIVENQGCSQIDYNATEDDVSQLTTTDSQRHCISLSTFLESPETPHRKGNKKYKRKSPAVLTCRRRLMYHKAVEEEKKRAAEEKRNKIEQRRKNAEERRKKAEEKRKKAEERKNNPAQNSQRKKIIASELGKKKKEK